MEVILLVWKPSRETAARSGFCILTGESLLIGDGAAGRVALVGLGFGLSDSTDDGVQDPEVLDGQIHHP